MSRHSATAFLVAALLGLALAEERQLLGWSTVDPEFEAHKAFFPMDGADWAGLVLTGLTLLLAAGCGMGGGAVLIPIFIMVVGFETKLALPLSNVSVLAGTVTLTAINWRHRHPLADRPQIDWDVMLIMEPPSMIGAVIGAFLSRVIPAVLLMLLLVLLLGALTHRTVRRGLRQWNSDVKEALDVPLGSQDSQQQLEEQRQQREQQQGTVAERADQAELALLVAQERHPPLGEAAGLLAVFVFTGVVTILKGASSFEPLGVSCGSATWWLLSLLPLPVIFAFFWRQRQRALDRTQLKQRLGYPFVHGDVQWDETMMVHFPFYCFLAGVASGLFGIGGGIIKGPLLLELDMEPQVVAATAAAMIVCTAGTATTSYAAFDMIQWDYALVCAILALAATVVGRGVFHNLVERYHSTSIIVFGVAAIIVISALAMTAELISELAAGEDVVGDSLC